MSDVQASVLMVLSLAVAAMAIACFVQTLKANRDWKREQE